MVLDKSLVNNITSVLERFKMDVIDFDTATDQFIDLVSGVSFRVRKQAIAMNYPTVTLIKSVVSEYFNMQPGELLTISSKQIYVKPRQIALYFCHELTYRPKNSLKQIAISFINTDHSGVLYAKKQVIKHMYVDRQYRKQVEAIKELIFQQHKKNNANFIAKSGAQPA